MRRLSTNAREVEQMVWHRSVSGNESGARCASQEVTTRVGFDRERTRFPSFLLTLPPLRAIRDRYPHAWVGLDLHPRPVSTCSPHRP